MAEIAPFRVSNPKRTRVLSTKQSKGGCITCKTRRVKCDESKPICQRCHRADRTCEYRQTRALSVISSSSSSSGSDPALSEALRKRIAYYDPDSCEPSPTYALSDGIGQSPEQSRLANLGCWVLSNDPIVDQIALPNANIWLELLPQLVHTTRTAYSAAAAFGAAYETNLIQNNRQSAAVTRASVLYTNALSALQEDLNNRSSGEASLLLSCILLACFEVLQRRRENALRHLEGAFKVLEIAEDENLFATSNSTPSSDGSSSNDMRQYSTRYPKKADLQLLLTALDLQTSTYALSRSPHLPADPSNDSHFDFTSINGADLQLTFCLHNVHHFTSPASRLKYLPPSQIPRNASIEQGLHLARLSLWLKCLDSNVLQRDLALPVHRHALMLRAQCLVAIIYTSNILCPYETGYDRHASSFQQVIDAATMVIEGKNKSSTKFRPGLGIIQPLLFTAVKYRHSCWRRKAIALMRRAGIEGPWDGRVEAAVAERVMTVEEEAVSDNHGESTPEMIPERKRVSGTHLPHDCYDVSDKTNKLRVSLSRCVDMQYMLSGKESYENPKHWNVWTEDVHVA